MSVLSRPTGSGRGLVLRAWPSGETSVIASVLTREEGMLRLMAKGARQIRSRLRSLVQPGRVVDLEFSLDPTRDLQFLRGGSLILDPLATAPTLETSAYLLAALELVDRCRPGDGRETGLFDLCEDYVQVLSCADAGCETAVYYAFEIALLDVQGTRPQLGACTQCGVAQRSSSGQALWFSPSAGGLVCGSCAAAGAAAGARPLTAPTLAAWPRLAAAPDAWPRETLSRTVARDWGVMLHRFLEYHLPGYRLPAALDMLRVGRNAATERPTEEDCS